MIRFGIRKAAKGSIEILLLAPVLALMAWGIGYVYLTLGQKNRLERASWFYGMSRVHKGKESLSRAQLNELLRDGERPFKIEEGRYYYELAASPGTRARSFPLALAGYLVKDCPKKLELTAYEKIGSGVLNMDFDTNKVAESIQNRSTILIPKSDFKGNWKLKQLMWFQLMVQIKREALPLQLLGLTEVKRAIKASGAGSDVAASFQELLDTAGVSPKFDFLDKVNPMKGLEKQLNSYKQMSERMVNEYVTKARNQHGEELAANLPSF
jgi:hypothetical protein